ncbi:hypothetical protein [Geitlerinema calcuttense]|nr:hypothetical protein [Geitlerinema calcuttense]MDL5056076.1 hypothetical protein [Geitlerinema calcuttense NRMC-F 0142]
MQISKKAVLILAEATLTSAVGLIHGWAGVVLTFGIAIAHIRFDSSVSTQPYSVEQPLSQKSPENAKRRF